MNSTAVRTQVEAFLSQRFPAALELRRPLAAERLSTGIGELDCATQGGIPRGTLSEICGAVSSGRSSLLLSLMAEVTQLREVCALVDCSGAFSPECAANAGIDLDRLLWICCADSSTLRRRAALNALERGIKVVDLLLQSGGFSLVAFDLGDLPLSATRRVPLASWFRFRRTAENTATAFVVLEQEGHAKSCASLVIQLQRSHEHWSAIERALPLEEDRSHTLGTVLSNISFEANISRGKPVGSAKSISLNARTSWAG
jgi:hypothetical protein